MGIKGTKKTGLLLALALLLNRFVNGHSLCALPLLWIICFAFGQCTGGIRWRQVASGVDFGFEYVRILV
jgi:hypothetical protein